MKEFVISDTHFLHKNILTYDNRPFSTIEEHTAGLIANWNSVVSKNDRVYHVGDFALRCSHNKLLEIVNSLNGELILIKGNHDNDGLCNLVNKGLLNIQIFDYLEFNRIINGKRYNFALMHYPIESWKNSYIHIHGHSHGKSSHRYNRIEVCCNIDYMNYAPIELEKIIEIVEINNKKLIDMEPKKTITSPEKHLFTSNERAAQRALQDMRRSGVNPLVKKDSEWGIFKKLLKSIGL